jgi:hypothetical protein
MVLRLRVYDWVNCSLAALTNANCYVRFTFPHVIYRHQLGDGLLHAGGVRACAVSVCVVLVPASRWNEPVDYFNFYT